MRVPILKPDSPRIKGEWASGEAQYSKPVRLYVGTPGLLLWESPPVADGTCIVAPAFGHPQKLSHLEHGMEAGGNMWNHA